MRPGLSGWARVCAPYASNIDDSDLNFLRPLLLAAFQYLVGYAYLFRTIKTVLKAGADNLFLPSVYLLIA